MSGRGGKPPGYSWGLFLFLLTRTEISTPSTTALTSSVETTAITGSDSSRMLSYIFFGSVVAPRPAMKSATTASLNDDRNAKRQHEDADNNDAGTESVKRPAKRGDFPRLSEAHGLSATCASMRSASMN